MSFFYRIYPELLKGGYIYRAETPLYHVISKGKDYYAYSDEELEILPKGEILRKKGIGELSPQDFQNTIFSSEGRYVQFTMEDGAAADYFFQTLMGNDIDERKKYIAENVNWNGGLE